MPCFHPLDARRSPGGQIAFKAMTPFDSLIKLPCGRCRGCRLERTRQWSVRLMHEAQFHERVCFITPTYRDEDLPGSRAATRPDGLVPAARSPAPELPQRLVSSRTRETHAHGTRQDAASLSPDDLQAFTKRLNQHARRKFGVGIKYFAAGEYGEKTHRPHYHLAVFGESFVEDRVFHKNSKSGHPLYRSKTLARLWPHGNTDIGQLTFESAAYIAGYIFNKVLGTSETADALREKKYRRTDEAGNDFWLQEEFVRMSKGLGKAWMANYKSSAYPHDRVIVNGKPAKPPRYYDKILEQVDQAMHDLVKQERVKNLVEEPPERLRAGEAILDARLKLKKRPLE